jgi:glycopeptide antibiotics resistance protein
MNAHDAIGILFIATYLKAKQRKCSDEAAMVYAVHMVYTAAIVFVVYVATLGLPLRGSSSLQCL